MTGTAGERRVDELPGDDGADDTTTAEAGPPASRRDEPGAGTNPHDAEDRTVQQTSPTIRRTPPPRAPPKPSISPAAGSAPPTVASAGASGPVPSAVPSTEPASPPAVPPTARSAPSPSITEASETEPPEEISDDDLTEDGENGEDDEDDADDDHDPDDDSVEDSITATAPRIDAGSLVEAALSGRRAPRQIPGSVEIRTVEHDELLDETEVRTLPGHVPFTIPATLRASPAPPPHTSSQPPPPPRPAAGRPPDAVRVPGSKPDIPVDLDDHDDDGVTTQARAPGIGSADEPLTRPGVEGVDEPRTRPGVEGAGEPPTRPGVEGVDEPATRPGLEEPETSKRVGTSGYANDEDEDESVTTRGRPAEPYDGDSVTTQAPMVPSEMVEAALKGASPIGDGPIDETEGTTKKARKPAVSSPADGESGSITSQAPGPLTNILRVIASGSTPDRDDELPALDDDEELPGDRTAVMPNAPQKRVVTDGAGASLPPIRPTGGPLTHGPQGSAALRLEPSSESGLRIARASAGSGERASIGPLAADGRNSGIGRTANGAASDNAGTGPNDVRAHAAPELAMFPAQVQPSLHDVDLGKGPRYGLLVAIVAIISVSVPVTLFVWLRYGSDSASVQAAPSEPASEIEKHDPPRAKAVRGKNGIMIAPSASVAPSASASPSASPSARPGSGPRGGPLPGRR
jgi:hypothetical protein